MIDLAPYRIADEERLLTPCLLVYPEIIQQNLRAATEIAGGTESLRPHVKTHKTPEIVRMQLEHGISKHKCATLREAEMLGETGVPDVLVAYPQVGPAIERFSQLVTQFPTTRFSTLVDDPQVAAQMSELFASRGQAIDVLIDIDSGMHRTGVPADDGAFELYTRVAAAAGLQAVGLHVYDGQNHQPDADERLQAVQALMRPVEQLVERLKRAGCEVSKLVCGGTPTFPIFARLAKSISIPVEFSPGTCVLSDYNYGRDYPDICGIRHAAVLMTRVISKRSGSGKVTCDLGNKAVAADPPAGSRCHFLGLEDVQELKQNEEHLQLALPNADHLSVGDVLYALPAHICPTVALHENLQVVREGRVVDEWRVTARRRLYH